MTSYEVEIPVRGEQGIIIGVDGSDTTTELLVNGATSRLSIPELAQLIASLSTALSVAIQNERG